jgi:hypothetical protein
MMSGEIATNVNFEIISGLISVVLVLFKLLDYGHDKLKSERETFYETIHKLSSQDNVDKISSAIALRAYIASRGRFFNRKLADEAIHVILAILKISPTGMLQKTLADSLSQAKNLNKCDFQRANLSNIYLSNRQIEEADFFECYAYNGSFKGSRLDGSHFNNAIFVNFVFNKCSLVRCDFTGADLSNSSFVGADLNGCNFEGAIINGCNFDGAVNVDNALFKKVFSDDFTILKTTVTPSDSRKRVFVSKPTSTTNEQQDFFERLASQAKKERIDFVVIERENYRDCGILENVRQKIITSDMVMVLGFIQVVADNATVKQLPVVKLRLPTSWNQIESGIAIGANKKVLFVKEQEINDGIFCNDLHGVITVEEVSLKDQNHVCRVVDRLKAELKNL